MFTWMRHWPRHALAAFAATLAVLAFGAWRTWALSYAQPDPKIDYLSQINALVMRDQPEGENAWPIYRRMFEEELGLTQSRKAQNQFSRDLSQALRESRILYGAWSDVDRTDNMVQLQPFRPLLDTLDEATALRRFAMPYSDNGKLMNEPRPATMSEPLLLSLFLPAIGTFNRISEVNMAFMRIAAEQGAWNEVVARFHSGIRLGEQLSRQASGVERRVAVRILRETMMELAHVLNEYTVPESALNDIEFALHDLDWSYDDVFPTILEQEHLMHLDVIQWTHDDGGMLLMTAADRFHQHGLNIDIGFELTNLVSPWFPGRAKAIRDSNRWLAGSHEAIRKLPPYGGWNPYVYRNDRSIHPVLRSMFWTVRSSLIETHVQASLQQGMLILIELERFHARRGAWPHSLDELASEVDVIDPISGDSFVYEQTPQEEHGRPFTLRIPWPKADNPRGEINAPRPPLSEAPAPGHVWYE
jgi:hypothetical protein